MLWLHVMGMCSMTGSEGLSFAELADTDSIVIATERQLSRWVFYLYKCRRFAGPNGDRTMHNYEAKGEQ